MLILSTARILPPMVLLLRMMAIVMAIAPIGVARAEGAPFARGAIIDPAPHNAAGAIDSSSLLNLPPEVQADMLAWVGAEASRMPKSMAPVTRNALLQTIWYEARRAGLEPATVLSIVDVASGFRKYFIGPGDTRGYMAVASHWVQEVGDGQIDRLFVMQVNLRYGCTLLRHDLDVARGDMNVALQLYQVQQAPDVDRPASGQARHFADSVASARRRWITDVEQPAASR